MAYLMFELKLDLGANRTSWGREKATDGEIEKPYWTERKRRTRIRRMLTTRTHNCKLEPLKTEPNRKPIKTMSVPKPQRKIVINFVYPELDPTFKELGFIEAYAGLKEQSPNVPSSEVTLQSPFTNE